MTLPDADIQAVLDAYRSGWLTMGPRTERLEAAFAAATGAPHAVAVATGAAARHLALRAAGDAARLAPAGAPGARATCWTLDALGGGVVTTADADLAARVRSLRSHAMTSVTWDRHRGHADTYDVVDVGWNLRIDEPRAALALSRLERAGEPQLAEPPTVVVGG